MKLPLSWLRTFVDVDLSVEELVDVMSLNGLEVESVETPGAGTAGVRTARVLHWQPHPDADRLRVVRVTGEGGDGEIELVCGAANFDVGDVVAHAVPGASIPGMTMEARSIRGVVSNGMLASARELQLSDEHEGILRLPGDTPLGADLLELLPLGEPVIEVAVQPDRGDHLSVLGVARDLAAILDTSWREPQDIPAALDTLTIPVELQTDACERFVTWALEDVRVQPSPPWLRQRLGQCGVRSIDVVVDVTNYVMLELGQPLHAFDLERIAGPRLVVRDARDGDRLVTLDDQERELVAGDVVIDDADGPVSLAGVMGGASTEVVAGTSRVLLEGAVWDPARIRRTSRRLNLVSEASQRFERRVDPEGAARGVARAVQLLTQLAGARPVGTDAVRRDVAWSGRATITVDPERIRRLLAVDELDRERQSQLLTRSGSYVQPEGDLLAVTAPTWRGDLLREADVAEEVARLHGYERIPATLPKVTMVGGRSPAQRLEAELRAVALAAGLSEAITRPFVGAQALGGVVPTEGRVELSNPLAKDASSMRPSLVEGLLVALRRNTGQGRPGTALVEFGRLFRPDGDALADALDAFEPIAAGGSWRWAAPDGTPLPIQPRTVALAAQGLRLGPDHLDPEDRWSVYDLLAVLDEMVRRAAPPSVTWTLERRPAERDGFHPGRSAALLLRPTPDADAVEIGFAGQLHPQEADRRDLPEPVVVAELLLEPLLRAVPPEGHPPVAARTLVRHPAMSLDVALVADEDVPYATLEAAVRDGAGPLLDGLWWFDEYRGEQVGDGRRSIAIRLRLQSPERQLTDADAEAVIDAVAARAEALGATLRR
ncbi:phenylalanine--tRNA ligase subunit beta [Egicoccus sp. AB-alg6-2]|uniref:phenylalanine--tRNA ligase subunit beta n=1 Tax=Egicoccus sp. AB-alg6-2 TaxID=3242692 RepID=UPI00359EAC00